MSLRRILLQASSAPADVLAYEFVAPLTARGRFATADWPLAKGACTVRRLHRDAADLHGALVQRRNGSWAFSYDVGEADDEVLGRFEKDVFAVGNEVKVTGRDGIARPFRVAEVGPFVERM